MSLKSCYDNSGSLRTGDVPCDPNAANSMCCGPGSVCVNNLYCTTPWGADVPGTCTDPEWGSSGYLNSACSCPPRYVGNNPLNYNDSTTYCSPNSFVCGAYNNSGCGASPMPIIYYNNAAAIPSSTVSLAAYFAGEHVSTASLSFTASSTHSTTASSATTSLTSTSIQTTSTSLAATALASSTPSSSASSSASNSGSESSSSSLSTGAEIGIGVGIGIAAVLILIALGIWFFRRSQRNNAQTPSSNPNAAYQYSPAGGNDGGYGQQVSPYGAHPQQQGYGWPPQQYQQQYTPQMAQSGPPAYYNHDQTAVAGKPVAEISTEPARFEMGSREPGELDASNHR